MSFSLFKKLFRKLVPQADTAETLAVGEKAPDFSLLSDEGKEIRLSDYRGKKNIALYFYPKDNTTICSAETKSFQDNYEFFINRDAEILGISSDSIRSHRDFSHKLGLSFRLLSDPKGKVRSLYKVPQFLGVIPGRTTYLIDKMGVIRQAWSSQLDAESHVELSMARLNELNQEKLNPVENR